eukprot:g20784.t1
MALSFVLPAGTAASPIVAPTTTPFAASLTAASAAGGAVQPGWAAACAVAAGAVAGARRQRKCPKVPRKFSLQMPTFPGFESKKKTVVITGASSGLGLSAAKSLAEQGWQVVMACRDFQKAEKAAKEAGMNPENYQVMHCDLASKQSVRNFVQTFRTMYQSLDALVCNAAVYFPNAHKEQPKGNGYSNS